MTSATSFWNRRSDAIRPSWMIVPSRTSRTCAPRRTVPLVTKQPAIVPTRDALKVWRTSALAIVCSTSSGSSRPSIEFRRSSMIL